MPIKPKIFEILETIGIVGTCLTVGTVAALLLDKTGIPEVYQDYAISQLTEEIGFLLLFSLLLLPLSFASFKFALKKARQQGSLVQY